jgi:TorA maturation chaperone TorD
MTIIENDRKTLGEAQARGLVYSILACGWRYPEGGTRSQLGALLEQVLEVREFLDEHTNTELDRLTQARKAGDEQLRSRYAELFGHAVRGACPLYELEYGQGEIVQQAAELADIGGFYRAFGLEPVHGGLERLDHIAVECEFMVALCAKHAAGIASSSSPLADSCFDAQRLFLRDHLSRWLPAFCSRVSKADGDGGYGLLARLSSAFLSAECKTFDITAGPEYLALRTADRQADVEIQCGSNGGDQLVPLTVGGSITEAG